MASNRLAESDDKFWSQSPKGFSFRDDSEAGEDPDQNYFGEYSRETAHKIKQELSAEVSSLQSFNSDASSDEPLDFSQRIKDLPGFLVGDGIGLEVDVERQLSLGQDLTKKHDRFHAPQIDETIHQLLIGAEVSFDSYKNLSQKKTLLNKATEINDGNAILAVTLFMFKTLKPSIFRQILLENKIAANHYIRYLETKNEISHLVDLLNMLGRTRDALLLRYKQILRKEGNLQNIIKELNHFNTAECQFSSDEDIAGLISQHLHLLSIHKEIKEKKDSSFPHSEYHSVLKTLRYISEHCYENSVPPLTVDSIKSKYSLNVKQYAWVILSALVKQQKWPQIETLLLAKSWLGGTKDKCLLPLEDVCHALHDAPVDLTARFVRLIDDPNKKLIIAKKLTCHMVVIDVYASQKDRAAILTYRSNLQENSKESVYAENILKNSGTKWKN